VGQGSENHRSEINADDDPVENLMGGNETPAFEEKPHQKGFIRPFLVVFTTANKPIMRSVPLSKDPKAVMGSGSASFPGQEKDDL